MDARHRPQFPVLERLTIMPAAALLIAIRPGVWPEVAVAAAARIPDRPSHRPIRYPEKRQHTGAVMASFEESLRKLENIVEQLERGDLALEESLKLFEEGVGLSSTCKKELDAAEGKVELLVKQRDGTVKTEPFLTEK
jgi:exodeoxyribonuclease VII small subunit